MTRKDFEAIAATLLQTKPLHAEGKNGIALQWRTTVSAFADMCSGQNPRFDRARFLKACGVTP